jgi:hypothetical protein
MMSQAQLMHLLTYFDMHNHSIFIYNNVWETELCLLPLGKNPTHLGPISKGRPYLETQLLVGNEKQVLSFYH